MFIGRGESVEPAKAMCAECLVKVDCLEFALENNIMHGIWGGESERGRRVIRKERTEVKKKAAEATAEEALIIKAS